LSSFKSFCDSQPLLFGKFGSRTRRVVSQRRSKLKYKRDNKFSNFREHCIRFGVECPESLAHITGTEDIEVFEETNNSIDRKMSTPMKSPPLLLKGDGEAGNGEGTLKLLVVSF
jgi:hypothetical protein